MTEENILYRLRCNEEQICQYHSEISRLMADIDELHCLTNKVRFLQERLLEDQARRRARLARASFFANRIKIARSYKEGMEELLNGAEFHRAYYRLEESIQRIRMKMNELEEKINIIRCKINHLKSLNNCMSFELMEIRDGR